MRRRYWRRYVSLVALVAAALLLSIHTATHSFFIGNNPETLAYPQQQQLGRPADASVTPGNNGTATLNDDGGSGSANKQHQLQQREIITFDNAVPQATIQIHSTISERSTPQPLSSNQSGRPNVSVVESPICVSAVGDDDEEWWISLRIGNINNDPRLSPQSLHPLILDPWWGQAVNQTLCHSQSRFLNSTQTQSHDDWIVRLTYIGIYLHQHLPARKEIQARQACSNHNVSKSTDYRCDPDTKYLVASLPNKGAGATFRTGAVAALLAGLAMNRVVVFVNGRTFGSVQMKSTWHLATTSVCPRGDYQCYFLPLSPCVLTEEEVRNATRQQIKIRADAWRVLAEANAPGNLTSERIVVVDAPPVPVYMDSSAKQRLRHRVYELVKDIAAKYNVPPQVLEELGSNSTKKSIRSRDQQQYYDHANSPTNHAALLYVLRPNWQFRQELDQTIQKALPKRGFRQEWSFGIPIRASDKCESESTCLTFDQYMQWAMLQYNKYSTNSTKQVVASLVLTSESKWMMNTRFKYTESSSFPFRFVVNVDDATQGTGTPRKYRGKDRDAHKVMLSTMAALKLQLLPKYSVVNCCSNFHQMILDLLRVGCGAVANPVFQCLQETDDPQFHVCCQWSAEERCKRAFEALRRQAAVRKGNSTK